MALGMCAVHAGKKGGKPIAKSRNRHSLPRSLLTRSTRCAPESSCRGSSRQAVQRARGRRSALGDAVVAAILSRAHPVFLLFSQVRHAPVPRECAAGGPHPGKRPHRSCLREDPRASLGARERSVWAGPSSHPAKLFPFRSASVDTSWWRRTRRRSPPTSSSRSSATMTASSYAGACMPEVDACAHTCVSARSLPFPRISGSDADDAASVLRFSGTGQYVVLAECPR